MIAPPPRCRSRLLLARALALAAASPVSVAPLQQPACEDCIADFVVGEDAGAYKDIQVDGCDGPCECSAVGSPCFDPQVGTAMKTGSVENQAACCALCSMTKDCVGWVIPSGVSISLSLVSVSVALSHRPLSDPATLTFCLSL